MVLENSKIASRKKRKTKDKRERQKLQGRKKFNHNRNHFCVTVRLGFSFFLGSAALGGSLFLLSCFPSYSSCRQTLDQEYCASKRSSLPLVCSKNSGSLKVLNDSKFISGGSKQHPSLYLFNLVPFTVIYHSLLNNW